MIWKSLTSNQDKIVGAIKLAPQDFIVEEVPLYLPCGSGQHLYLTLTKSGMTTTDLAISLSKIFNKSEKEIGYAGMKDKLGITTQIISIDLGAKASIDEVKKIIEEKLPTIKINNIERHNNKLKTGHLKGNRFEITIHHNDNDAQKKIQKITEKLMVTGLPNYYGNQRFGSKQDNHIEGLKIIKGEKQVKKHWLKKLQISAWQSFCFNQYLQERISLDRFDQLLPGDLLINSEGSNTFSYQTEEHKTEFEQHLVTFTGPMFGISVKNPTLDALYLEEKIFQTQNLTQIDLEKNRIEGTRRAGRISLKDFSFEVTGSRIKLKFYLPSGSYATALLNEFVLTPDDLPDSD